MVPSGWTHRKGRPFNVLNASLESKLNATIHLIPYSEHSSYKELGGFLSWLNPQCIIATVGAGEKCARKTARHLRSLTSKPIHVGNATVGGNLRKRARGKRG
mmetsp:Transcript_11249/g.22108  ORF Transcript_11249/g.22108 Transcript_11249/m.22108 type:complete len:102 (+) Transcript_11249:417-722(+)